MNYTCSFIFAVLFTSSAYFLADFTLFQYLHWMHPLLVGLSVVTAGALAEKLNSPMWLIILLPFPIGMGMLLAFLNWDIPSWLATYTLTLIYYTLIHMTLSRFFNFHSLIPAWRLR